jgi:hypothetical protein
MLLKDSSRTKNNQELVKASIDALVEALESQLIVSGLIRASFKGTEHCIASWEFSS